MPSQIQVNCAETRAHHIKKEPSTCRSHPTTQQAPYSSRASVFFSTRTRLQVAARNVEGRIQDDSPQLHLWVRRLRFQVTKCTFRNAAAFSLSSVACCALKTATDTHIPTNCDASCFQANDWNGLNRWIRLRTSSLGGHFGHRQVDLDTSPSSFSRFPFPA